MAGGKQELEGFSDEEPQAFRRARADVSRLEQAKKLIRETVEGEANLSAYHRDSLLIALQAVEVTERERIVDAERADPALEGHFAELDAREQQRRTEEGSTKDFAFSDSATALGIPEESWDSEQVRDYVGLYNRANQLQHDLSVAQVKHRQASGNMNLAQTRDLFGAPDMKTTISDKFGMAELLMRGVISVLDEGFGQPAADFRGYMKEKLNAALRSFKLEIVDRREAR